MILKKNVILVVLLLVLILMFGCVENSEYLISEKEINSEQVTLFTEVEPLGEVVRAIIISLHSEPTTEVTRSSFEVWSDQAEGERKESIDSVYLSHSPIPGNPAVNGTYVVIELEGYQDKHSTLSFNEEYFLNVRDRLEYFIVLKEDIYVSNQEFYEASNNKLQAGLVSTSVVDDFGKHLYVSEDDSTMPYRLYEPDASEEPKPLILFLHGSGERGADNELQLLGSQGGVVWATPQQQKNNPAYVLAPQAPFQEELTAYWIEEDNYNLLENLLYDIISNYNIDHERIYVTGVSNGGTGTWHIALNNPDLFAGIVPVCGVANTEGYSIDSTFEAHNDISYLEGLRNMPVWIFHAEDDHLVSVEHSREAVEALTELGNTSINYTEYGPDTIVPNGHYSWVPAFQTQEMIDWLFKQSK